MHLLLPVISLFLQIPNPPPGMRTVQISWQLSVTPGVTGYGIFSQTTAGGPQKFVGCTGTVPQQTCLAGTDATTTQFFDQQPQQTSVMYQMLAYGIACAQNTPLTTPCGQSDPVSFTVNIPIKPAPPQTTVIIVN